MWWPIGPWQWPRPLSGPPQLHHEKHILSFKKKIFIIPTDPSDAINGQKGQIPLSYLVVANRWGWHKQVWPRSWVRSRFRNVRIKGVYLFLPAPTTLYNKKKSPRNPNNKNGRMTVVMTTVPDKNRSTCGTCIFFFSLFHRPFCWSIFFFKIKIKLFTLWLASGLTRRRKKANKNQENDNVRTNHCVAYTTPGERKKITGPTAEWRFFSRWASQLRKREKNKKKSLPRVVTRQR